MDGSKMLIFAKRRCSPFINMCQGIVLWMAGQRNLKTYAQTQPRVKIEETVASLYTFCRASEIESTDGAIEDSDMGDVGGGTGRK